MSDNQQLTNREQATAVWQILLQAKWEKESDGFFVWRKSFPLFHAFVEELEPNKFVISLETSTHIGLYEQLLAATYSAAALEQADQIIYEFIAMGAESLGGFSISIDRPANEIRIIQLISHEHHIYGIDQYGVVHLQEHGNGDSWWTKCSMKRASLSIG